MLLDALTTFGEDFDVTEAAGTYNFTNQIDLGAEQRDIGNGKVIYLVISVSGGDDGIITGGSAGTIAFRLVSDASASIATDGSATLHWQSKSFVTDGADANELKQGDKVCIAIPLEDPAYERYLGVQAVIATTTVTEGTVDAYLTYDAPKGYKAYAQGDIF